MSAALPRSSSHQVEFMLQLVFLEGHLVRVHFTTDQAAVKIPYFPIHWGDAQQGSAFRGARFPAVSSTTTRVCTSSFIITTTIIIIVVTNPQVQSWATVFPGFLFFFQSMLKKVSIEELWACKLKSALLTCVYRLLVYT